jgi:hypothetical protein
MKTSGYYEQEYASKREVIDIATEIVTEIVNNADEIEGKVLTFANLPLASSQTDKIWLVEQSSGVWLVNYKQAGLYKSDGTIWNLLDSTSDIINTLNNKADKLTTITTGNGLAGGGDLSANRTISHSDTSTQANVVNTNGNVIQSANLDDFGHITSFSSIDLDNRYVLSGGAYANPTWITSLDANKLTGTIPSNVLGASTVYIGTTAIALNRASGNQALTGINSIQYVGATSGTATMQAPAVAGTTTFTLPTTNGNLIGSGDVGSVSNTMLAGSIADSKLNTITTAGKVANSSTSATNLNTVNTIVSRDASGNFNAGTITASLSGNSTTATTLQTARTINGVSFNGSANITITANTPNTLTIASPLTGGSFNGGSAVSIGIQTATSLLSGALSNTDWNTFNTAYNRSPTGLSVTGTTTKTITLTKQDGTTLTANWSDLNTDAVTSVFGRTGAVVATEGDYSLNLLSDVTITTPATNQLLQYNGTNWVNWTSNYLTLTSLSATSPLNYNNTTGVFSINQSNTTTNGFLSSVDWNTFNNKQNAITLTTTGSSGASTFVSNTLNIPNYTLAGLGGQPLLSGTGFVKANGTTITYDNSTYLTANQTITLSGDITGSGTTAITTALANSGVVAGTYQSATTITPLTIDAKGRVTSVGAATTIAPAFSSITGKPTTINGYGITDGVTLTGTETLTNKTFTDNTTFFQDNLDNSKKAQFELSNIATATTRTYTLPNVNGTIITTGDTATVTNTMLAGSIADSKLNTITTAGKVANSSTSATNLNTASSIVARDASGNFSAGTITGALSGNSTTATTLQTARTINGTSFDGSANITITANTTNALTISSPLTGTSFNGSSAVSIGIQTASSTLSGALSSTDWSTFNNKQSTISLTTTGNSGASSFVSNVLNIPNYTLSGLGGQPALNGTGFVKISGTTISYDNSTYLTGNQTITLSGDITGSGTTAITTTLANSGATAGTYQTATTINPLTIDSKGRITSTGTAVTIAPLFSSIASKPTTISGYGITDGATLTGTQTLTNKTFTDNTTFFQDDLDNTKKAQFQLSSIATATTRTYTLPNNDGVLITNGDTGTVTNTMLAGSIADSKLSTIATAGKVANSATTATNANTASAIVARNASGNFSAGTITASLSGNSTTATTLQTARTINGVSFNGSANITVEDSTKLPLAGGTLTGQLVSTLASGSQVYLNGSTSNQIEFNTAGSGVPTYTTRSAGNKIILYPFVGSFDTDFAIGMDVPIGALWQSVGNSACIFKWYFGDSEGANLSPDRFSCFGYEAYDFSISGYFKVSNYFGGNTITTLSTNNATDNAPVVVNPKIPYCVNATNGYNGTLTGANIRFASDTTATNIWDVGVGANAVGTDTFSIGRANTSLFTMTSTGNITTQLISTRANNTANGGGQIYLNGATGNRIDFNTNGTATPAFTTRSAGTKIVLYPQVGASTVDYAIGIESGALWYSVGATSNQHIFYGATTQFARIKDTGISTRGNIYEGNSAFTTLNTTSTLTIAQLLTLVIESTPTANITFTLPTGTNTDAGVMSSLETFASFTWSIVNRATGFTITMAGNTGNTYIGNTTITANTSATFRTQKTAANTFKTVRI